MRVPSRLPVLLVAFAAILVGGLASFADRGGEDDPLAAARRDMIQRRWQEAEAELTRFLASSERSAEEPEARILLARARLLRGAPEAAVTALESALESIDPASPWHAQARYLMAEALEGSGRDADASRILAEQAALLESSEYRGRLAGRLEALGHLALKGAPSRRPAEEPAKPDHARATLLFEAAARTLDADGLDPVLSPLVARTRMDAGDAGGALAEAIRALEMFGKDGRRADADAEARLLLVKGRAELAMGRLDDARKSLVAVESRAGSDAWFSDVQLLLGRTFGIPGSSSPGDVRAGLEHWGRYLVTADDDGARRVRRESIAACLAAGLIDEAERASRDFLAHHPGAEDAPDVLRGIAGLRTSRGDHDGAVAVLEEFLATYPDDAAQAEVRENIPQVLFQKAIDARHDERMDDALTALTNFVTRYPVHLHAPVATLEIGFIHEIAGRHDAARDVWLRASQRYASLAPENAATAGFKAALILEERKGRLEEAVAEFRAIVRDFGGTAAAATVRVHLAAMETESVRLTTPRVATSDNPARVELELRNVESARVRVYPVDFETWYRSKLRSDGFESLDVALVKAAREVVAGPEDYRRYKQEKLDVVVGDEKTGRLAPGLYLITAEDGSRRSSVALLVSDLRAVVKRGPRSLFVFAQDVRTGKVVPGAKVLVSDGKEISEQGETGDDGTWRADYDEDSPRSVFVIHGGHAAPTGDLGGADPAPTSFSARGWVSTDRGVYRPGESLKMHAIVRRAGRDDYGVPAPGEELEVLVRDSRGRVLDRRDVAAATFGTVATSFDLPPESPLGEYRVEVRDGISTFTQSFEVEAWRPAEFAVRVVTAARGDVALEPGSVVPVAIRVRDLFDNPVPGVRVFWRATRLAHVVDTKSVADDSWAAPVKPTGPREGSTIEEGFGITDAEGKVEITVATESRLATQRYVVAATVVGDERTTQTGVGVFHTAVTESFGVITTNRRTYREGDVIHAEIRTVGPSSRPVPSSGRLIVLARSGLDAEPRVLETRPVSTGLDGRATVELSTPSADVLVLRYEAAGERGARFETTITLRADGYDADRDVRVSVTKNRYLVGEPLVAYLDLPATASPVLLTFEGQRVIDHRVLIPSRRREIVEWLLERRHAPGVVIAAAQFHDGELRVAEDRAEVRRRLTLEVATDREEYQPGDEVELALTARDQLGRPVAASLAVAVVDRAALELGGADKGDLVAYFRPPERPHRITTVPTTAWTWGGGTALIDEDLAEHARRQELQLARKALSTGESDDFKLGLLRFEKSADDHDEDDFADEPAEAIGLGGGAGGSFGGRHGGKKRSRNGISANKDNADKFTGGTLFRPGRSDPEARAKWVNPPVAFAALAAALDPEPSVEIETRSDLRTLAFFDGEVVTGADGRAVVRFKLPENVTSWSVHATGVTSSTHVGETETAFASRRPLTVELSTPRFLVDGDRSSVRTLVARHDAGEVDVDVVLSSTGSISASAASQTVRVTPGRRAAVDTAIATRNVGTAKLRATASARGGAGDAIERVVRVVPFGEPMSVGGNGTLERSAVLDFARDGEVVEGTGRCTLTVSTGAPADLVDAVGQLLTSRNASVEVAAARLRATVSLLALIDATGIDVGIARRDLEDAARRDVLRLLAARRDDGTLGWWTRCGPDAYVTATALEALVEASRLGLTTPADVATVLFGARALLGQAAEADEHAYLVCALAQAGAPDVASINRIARGSRRLSIRGLAALCIAAHRADREVQSRELQGLLETRLAAASKKRTARRFDGEILDAAWALRALLVRETTGTAVRELVEELRDRGDGPSWGGPQATAAASVALALVLRSEESSPARGTIDVILNGKAVETIDLSAQRRAGSIVRRLAFTGVNAGDNRLELKARDAASCRFTFAAEWMRPVDRIEARPGSFTVRRRVLPRRGTDDSEEGWSILVPESRPRPDEQASLEQVEEGMRYLVQLDLVADEEHSRVVVEDALPAGLEVFDVGSTGHVHHERRDESVAFYFEVIPKGVTRIEYTVYGAHPGSYRAGPARAWVTNDPRLAGASADIRLAVLAHGEASARIAAPEPTPDALLERGRKAYSRGGWAECRSVLRPLLQLDLLPEHRDSVMTMLFDVGLRTGESAEAVDLYDRIVLRSGAEPTMSSADRLELGRAFDAVGDHARARQIFYGVVAAAFERENGVHQHELSKAGSDAEPASSVRAGEKLTELVIRYPQSEAVRARWFEAAEAWFATPHPERAGSTSIPESHRYLYERGLDEVTRAMSHLPTTREAEAAGHRMLLRLRGLGLAARTEREAQWFLERHPESIHADDAQLLVMQATFSRGDYAGAGRAATALTEPKWFAERHPGAKPRFSEHRDEAVFTLGRIAHVEGRIEEAVRHYGAIADKFDDARQSYLFFTEKRLEVPEIDVVAASAATQVSMQVTSKNVHEARAWLYSVDLDLVLTVRKSLRALNRVDLTGLEPMRSFDISLAQASHREHVQEVDLGELPVGAWLVVLRSESITRTGIVVVSPLEVKLQRDGNDVRVWVTRAGGAPVGGAEVLAGDGSRIVGTGTTDERGILVLRSVPRGITVVASSGKESALVSEQ